MVGAMGGALAASAWSGEQSPGVALVALAFLVPSTTLVFVASPRRPLQYPFAFGSLALFLVVGVGAVRVIALATAAGMLLRWRGMRASEAAGPLAGAGAATPAAMAIVGAAICVGVGAGAAVAWLLGVSYPVPLGETADLGRFFVIVCVSFVVFVASKELGNAWLARRNGAVIAFRFGDTVGVYVAALIVGLPMQVAAHALYGDGHLGRWSVALAWAFLVNAVIGRQVSRMRRTAELREELARKERMAAIGEVTARVLHHTRHQMGLVGMIAHQITRRLQALPEAEARPIADELGKLKAVQEDLQQALTVDVGDDVPRAIERGAVSRPPWETLLRTQAARLEPLAADRAIAVDIAVAAGVPAGLGPRSPVRLGHAFSNVLENAISAAAARVAVELARDGEWLVIRVADDGPGMADDFIARATEPFVTTKREGSGMGLAITRAVVEEEDGTLEIANRAEGVLVVQLRLPLRAQDSIS